MFELAGTLGDKRLATWLVVRSGIAVIVDTGVAGWVQGIVRPALATVGAAPGDVREVLVTHADVDHYGGVAEARSAFPAAALRAGAADRPLIERWNRIVAERYGWYRQHGLDYEAAVWDALPGLKGPDTALHGVLAPGDVVAYGGVELEVLSLPGHTAGHVGLFERRSGVAIVADALLGDGVPSLDGRIAGPPVYVSVPAYRRTIDAVAELGARELRTSHWPVSDGRDPSGFVRRSRAFVERLEEAVLDAVEPRPRGLADLWPRLDARLGPFRSLGVELARSIHSHLEDLAARGLVERVPGAPPSWRRR